MQIAKRLAQLESEGKPIRVGVVGCGQMGSGLVHVLQTMDGMRPSVIADIDVQKPLDTLAALGFERDGVAVCDSPGAASDAIRVGKPVVTQDALLVPQIEALDAVVEGTGVTEIGASVAWNSILNKKHVVMLNVETDVTVGVLLNHLAHQTGCVYTAAAGDEPGVLNELFNFAQTLGFEVVCLGKGKNNALDLTATAESCREEGLARGMNPKMLASFKDGTKTMVEMAAVSNATGLTPDVPGMHGARVDLDDLTNVFVPDVDGGIFSGRGHVDFSTGKVAPGVFAIVTTDEKRIRTDMAFVGMGEGPYYRLYRPYHLCNIETPMAIVDAVLYNEVTSAAEEMVSEVVAIAKRDLRAGETLGDIGGTDFLGRIYCHDEAQTLSAVPMGLATGAKVVADVRKGDVLTTRALAPDPERFVYQARKMQDALLRHRR